MLVSGATSRACGCRVYPTLALQSLMIPFVPNMLIPLPLYAVRIALVRASRSNSDHTCQVSVRCRLPVHGRGRARPVPIPIPTPSSITSFLSPYPLGPQVLQNSRSRTQAGCVSGPFVGVGRDGHTPQAYVMPLREARSTFWRARHIGCAAPPRRSYGV